MISVDKATSLLSLYPIELESVEIPIEESIGFCLNENIFAKREQPPFDRVAMDGVAIAYSVLELKSKNIKIEGVQKAGSPVKTLNDNSCAIEVMTGACLPLNCDTVVPYEEVSINNGKVEFINSNKINKSQNIHFQGTDYKEDDLLLESGAIITSAIVAVLASQGMKTVKVKKIPKIAVISTGDELVSPGSTPEDWQIWRSNPYAIKAELVGVTGIKNEDIVLYHLNDNKEELVTKLADIINNYKFIIMSGGVSKGKFDFIPSVLSDLGSETIFHKIKQRPGKPMLFAVGSQKQLIFGLPGNPVSALICLRRYVVESIIKSISNQKNSNFVKLVDDLSFKKDLTLFKPVKVLHNSKGEIVALPISGNGSGDFSSLTKSDGFIELDESIEEFQKGHVLKYFPWNRC